VIERAASEERVSLARLIAQIDAKRVAREPDQPLSSACRVFALERVQKLIP
jgi:predicted DNA-binding ribbon-helix-helix protein